MSARAPLALFVAMGLFWGTWAALLPDVRSQVGASDGELGLALLSVGAGALVAMIICARLWPRFGWWLLPLTGAFFALAVLGPIVARSPVSLAAALLFVGAASGSMDVAMNAAVSDVEAASGRRLMYGAHALFSLAVLVGSVVTGVARAAGAGPAEALPVVAVALAAMCAVTLVSARRAPMVKTIPLAAVARGNKAGRALRAVAGLAVLCALSFLIEDAVQNWSALQLEREVGSGAAMGGAAPGIFAGAMFGGRSAGQWLGARFTDRSLLVAGALGAALGLLLLAYAPNVPIAIVGLVLAGAGVALVAPALFARAGRSAGARGRGAAIASLTVFGYTGFLAGPAIVGLLSQAAGLRFALAALSGAAMLLALGGMLVLRAPGRRGTFATGEELLRTGRG